MSVQTITKVVQFYTSDTITAPVTGQLKRLVAGSVVNVGSPVTAVAFGNNCYGAQFSITLDASGDWDGWVLWSDSSGSPITQEAEVYISPNVLGANRKITKLSPYLTTDVLTGTITAQVQQLIGGVWTNVGAPVTAVATGQTNSYAVELTITPDGNQRFDGAIVWSDSAGSPVTQPVELILPFVGSATTGTVVTNYGTGKTQTNS